MTLGRSELAELHVDAYATRAEWLAARRAPDSIGASEAAMALGVSPYGTPFAFWDWKQRAPERSGSLVLTRGHRWEPAVLAEYEDESGHQVLTPATAVQLTPGEHVVLSNRRYPWLRETPDAFAIDGLGRLGQVEAKTAMQARAWSPDHGIVIQQWDDSYAELVPAHYAVQGYVQLAISELPWVDLCALVPRGMWLAVRWVRLERDVATQDALVETLAEWRERHLVSGEAPPIDGSEQCNRYLARRFPSDKFRPERLGTPEEIAGMQRLAEIRAAVKALDIEGDRLRNLLLESAQGYRLRAGFPYKTAPYGQPQVSAGKTSIDVARLRAEQPDIAEQYERRGEPFATFNLYRF